MAKEKEDVKKMQVTRECPRMREAYDQEQIEKDMKEMRKFNIGCNCFGCMGPDDEIKISHPWFFGAYRERKERERRKKFYEDREQNIAELKKILAEYEQRLEEEEKKKQNKPDAEI